MFILQKLLARIFTFNRSLPTRLSPPATTWQRKWTLTPCSNPERAPRTWKVFRVPLPPSKRAKTIASSCEAVSGEGITPESVVVASERHNDFRREDSASPPQRVTTTQIDTPANYSTPAQQPTRSNVISRVPIASSSSVVSAPSNSNVMTHHRSTSQTTPDFFALNKLPI
ncbi:hypothetical protein AVEN_192278-1 [Araneus ventricosus]|uniref:Uncharacterized protein n=1 Tax=Araneus ventricosus TaxID=182803 RepID=A0A4Y2TWQ5_ARAVE|nr:hypothetical protein AVEN_192278-1 [Araneus ventricosus]